MNLGFGRLDAFLRSKDSGERIPFRRLVVREREYGLGVDGFTAKHAVDLRCGFPCLQETVDGVARPFGPTCSFSVDGKDLHRWSRTRVSVRNGSVRRMAEITVLLIIVS